MKLFDWYLRSSQLLYIWSNMATVNTKIDGKHASMFIKKSLQILKNTLFCKERHFYLLYYELLNSYMI